MKFLFFIFLSIISLIGNSQPISTINLGEVKITDNVTGNNIKNNSPKFKREQIVSAFGTPDSIKTEMVEAVGGLIEKYYYDKNYFFLPADEYASSGYQILTNRFSVTIKDTITVFVGAGVEKLTKIIDSDHHYTNREINKKSLGVSLVNGFNLYYYNEKYPKSYGNAILDIVYDPRTLKILKISEYPRS